jgi:hypothetical protein
MGRPIHSGSRPRDARRVVKHPRFSTWGWVQQTLQYRRACVNGDTRHFRCTTIVGSDARMGDWRWTIVVRFRVEHLATNGRLIGNTCSVGALPRHLHNKNTAVGYTPGLPREIGDELDHKETGRCMGGSSTGGGSWSKWSL